MKELQIATGIFLLLNSCIDIWKKRISIISLVIYLLTWMLFFWADISWRNVLIGILPGFILCIIGKLSGGALGLGDGILVMAVGACLGIQKAAVMVMWGFLLAFIWSVVWIVVRKCGKDAAFPFIPFLFLGFFAAIFI